MLSGSQMEQLQPATRSQYIQSNVVGWGHVGSLILNLHCGLIEYNHIEIAGHLLQRRFLVMMLFM